MTADIWLIGGSRDPNIAALAQACEAMGVSCLQLTPGPETARRLTWDFSSADISWGGEALVAPRAAFQRFDVFDQLAGEENEGQADAWYTLFQGWLAANENVRLLNRSASPLAANKPYSLRLALACGLPIPRTLLSNDEQVLDQARAEGAVCKPVQGGAHCVALGDIWEEIGFSEGVAAAPAIVQERLRYPEFRVFRIGRRMAVYRIVSGQLDYRADRRVQMTAADLSELPAPVREGLEKLFGALQLDFAAVDLKSGDDGVPRFLEVNTMPMFAGFDVHTGGALSRLIVETLLAD